MVLKTRSVTIHLGLHYQEDCKITVKFVGNMKGCNSTIHSFLPGRMENKLADVLKPGGRFVNVFMYSFLFSVITVPIFTVAKCSTRNSDSSSLGSSSATSANTGVFTVAQ